ncbi:hypothetical protein LN042_27205 [Kitasatospora sp. RB6PN24]|uniref:hypothetical protein n=1 Tax=Kitasatospora humi TaxID=2893891 RepID=UPI001E3DC72E|nr:hypothetical protein [Kitasatospora humi]MCC9310715.1 hypothetical protein [Kitasatospora humi]
MHSLGFDEVDNGVGDLDAAESEFIEALLSEMAVRAPQPATSYLLRDEDIGGRLVASVQLAWVPFGARFDGSTVHCDELHCQLYCLPEEPTELALEASGSPNELGRLAAAWFDTLLRRPVVRHEWVNRGQVYADRTFFSDSGRILTGMVNSNGIPLKRWFRQGLGPADRVVQVRGEHA